LTQIMGNNEREREREREGERVWGKSRKDYSIILNKIQ
jgi:hypothetical protein